MAKIRIVLIVLPNVAEDDQGAVKGIGINEDSEVLRHKLLDSDSIERDRPQNAEPIGEELH